MQTSDPPYEVALEKSHSRITIKPQLTEADWADIERAGDDILEQINGHSPRGLMVDLTPLNYMGSSMVAMIVRCWKAIAPKEQQFVVVSNSDVVREVLQLSGLARMWTIVSTREEGLKSLGITPAVAAGESPSGHWLIVLGALSLIVAVAGVIVWFAESAQRELATGLIYGGAGGTFVVGLLVMMIAHGKRRLLGLAMVVVGVCAALFRVMQ